MLLFHRRDDPSNLLLHLSTSVQPGALCVMIIPTSNRDRVEMHSQIWRNETTSAMQATLPPPKREDLFFHVDQADLWSSRRIRYWDDRKARMKQRVPWIPSDVVPRSFSSGILLPQESKRLCLRSQASAMSKLKS